jgi:hypothetical protein
MAILEVYKQTRRFGAVRLNGAGILSEDMAILVAVAARLYPNVVA